MTARIYGYFDDPAQTKPAYDPGFDVNCPICNTQLSRPVKTISLALYDEDAHKVAPGTFSYFYRVHKDCYDALTEEQQTDLDSVLIDAIAQTRNTN